MGSPSSDPLGPARPTPGYAAQQRDYVPPAPEPDVRRPSIVRHLVLFAATVLTTTLVGVDHYYGFQAFPDGGLIPFVSWTQYLNGLWYSATVLGILGTHEMGHYLACRYYRVDASLPYFLPLPPPFPSGTLGAFIRIRQPIADKRQLFDIGIAGPIAGFLVAVPLLIAGVSLSRVVAIPPALAGETMGEPLLLKGLVLLMFGHRPPGYDIILHPIAFAGWFGMLATALNLFPFGQLDGGHISYAVFGRRSTVVTYATLVCLLVLSLLSVSWVVWTILLGLMLYFFGAQHPRTSDEDMPLDTGRLLLAAFAVVMFVLCFTPVPVPVDWPALFRAMRGA
jgi:membrane-associated protease RseP (regulator of RpoE activity)